MRPYKIDRAEIGTFVDAAGGASQHPAHLLATARKLHSEQRLRMILGKYFCGAPGAFNNFRNAHSFSIAPASNR